MSTMSSRRSPRVLLLCLVFTLFFTWLDLWTKDLAKTHLPCEPGVGSSCRLIPGRPPERAGGIVLVEGYLDLAYAENRGAAFSMLHDSPKWVRTLLFNVAGLLAVAFLSYMLVSGQGGVALVVAVPLVVSGAIGNLVDRFRLGYVVDFIRFHLHDGWEWPTFNIADCTIAVGVALLFIDGMRKVPAKAQDGSGTGAAGEHLP